MAGYETPAIAASKSLEVDRTKMALLNFKWVAQHEG